MATIRPNRAVTDVRQSPNMSAGRPAGSPNQIVIHHWGSDGQRHDSVVSWLCKPGSGASAHYVASAGRVTQLVSDTDRAWHAGRSGNPRGIGIECRPEMSRGDWDTVVNLVKAIREEHGMLPIVGHRDHMQTACPGRWYGRLAALDAAARGAATSSGSAVASAPAADSGWAMDGYGTIPVTGEWDAPTVRRFTRVMNAWAMPLQFSYANLQRFLNGYVPASAIRSLTGADALAVDGDWERHTTIVLQFLLWSWVPGAPACQVWQQWARGWDAQKFIDGQWGPATCAVLQEALNRSWGDSGKLMIDPHAA